MKQESWQKGWRDPSLQMEGSCVSQGGIQGSLPGRKDAFQEVPSRLGASFSSYASDCNQWKLKKWLVSSEVSSLSVSVWPLRKASGLPESAWDLGAVIGQYGLAWRQVVILGSSSKLRAS